MQSHLQLIIIGVLGIFQTANAQQGPVFVADPYSYGIDEAHHLIVLNTGENENIIANITTLQLDKEYHMVVPADSLSNTHTYQVTQGDATYTVFVTKTPVIHITLPDTALTKIEKNSATFRYFDTDTVFSSNIGMKLRGNLSLTYPKKSFSIEFYQDSLPKEKKEVDFKKLRKDDDWILDGLYNEPLLLRANTAQKLWKDIHGPAYIEQEKKARSTVDGFYIDLFVNNEYRGIYFLSEKVNRSLLKLKKIKDGVVRGELFKAGRYLPGTSFKEAPSYKNSLPTWAGFEMEYPYEDYTAHWDNLQRSISLVADSNTNEFAAGLPQHFDVHNLIDYYLFINLLRGTDNLGKNYYIARYNQEMPYFIVPWDMDGTFGTIMDGRRIATTNDLLSNHLFDRLVNENPNGFNSKLVQRWNELRQHSFSNDSLHKRIRSKYTKLLVNKMYERDVVVWKVSHNEEHLNYMLEWLEKRLAYLDSYFNQ